MKQEDTTLLSIFVANFLTLQYMGLFSCFCFMYTTCTYPAYKELGVHLAIYIPIIIFNEHD